MGRGLGWYAVVSGLCLVGCGDDGTGGAGADGGTGGIGGQGATAPAGGGSTGGSGGIGAAGGSGAGGSGGTGGTGGAECATTEDCPSPPSVCASATCDDGVCGVESVAENEPTAEQTDGDCQLRVCDGAGSVVIVADDGDEPNDGNDCTEDTCEDGAAMFVAIAGDCAQAGGVVCGEPLGPNAGECVECNVDAECEGDDVCDPAMSSGTCVDASCADGAMNGDETDVDCGGPVCGPCANASTCLEADDCASGFCNAGVCSACGASGDCEGNEWCDPSIDGGTCIADLATGTACSDASQCGTGFCVDGTCCDDACDGQCDACTAALKGSGVDGFCEPIMDGTDPDDECASEDPTTCGRTGSCDGASACELQPAMTLCATPTCSAGTASAVDLCDGAGSCVDGGTTSCAPFVCDAAGLGCLVTCGADTDCTSEAYCDAGTCAAKSPNGGVCFASNACASGSCVDGVCCNNDCSGSCEACNVPGSVGTCSDFPNGTDPSNECAGAYACNGFGVCQACGDGVMQAGEACDDGNLTNGDGCQSDCTVTPPPNPLTVCVNPNQAINGAGPGINNPTTLTFPALPGPITDVNFTTNINHTWVGDLDVRLIHLGVTRFMIDNVGQPASTFGCATDNISVTLDDEAAGGPVENVCNVNPPGVSGSRTPFQSLNAFDGMNAQGTWSLVIDDTFAGGDDGTLVQWCLSISY